MPTAKRLEGKVAIVTGGGSGIGAAVARMFGAEGAKVAVADYDDDAAQTIAREVWNAGGEAFPVSVDVSDSARVQKMVSATLETYGRIDILVNGAGTLVFGTVLDTGEQEWNRVISVNLTGTFLCCRAVLPYMVEGGGGSIVNFSSSTGAHDAAKNTAAYVASKGGVALLTKAMAVDHAAQNVRVNAICPGPTDTPMLRQSMSVEQLKQFAASFPMGRLGQPEEIARCVLFLASDEASFVTGAMVAADGGQTAEV